MFKSTAIVADFGVETGIQNTNTGIPSDIFRKDDRTLKRYLVFRVAPNPSTYFSLDIFVFISYNTDTSNSLAS